MGINAPGTNAGIRTIVVFKGSSQYDVLGEFLADISVAFNDLGYRTVLVDFFLPGWPETLHKAVSSGTVVLFFSMNGNGGQDVVLNGVKFEDFATAPMFSFYVDHPCCHINKIDSGLSDAWVSFVDGTHLDFMDTFVVTEKPCRQVFIPHGGSRHGKDAACKSISSRSIDILFAGSYSDPDSIRASWQSTNVGVLLDTISESALFESNKPLLQVFVEVFAGNGIDINIMKDRSTWCFFRAVDSYVRAKRRQIVLESFSDFNIQVYGNGWETFNAAGSRNHMVVNSPLNYAAIQDKMADAKIVLNILPYFTQGGHERIFSSMLAGAVCLSDENSYLAATFKNGENILLFGLGDGGQPERIAKVLADPSLMQLIADDGRTLTLEKHMWFNRAEQILQAVAGDGQQ